jgi:hypothetical protein
VGGGPVVVKAGRVPEGVNAGLYAVALPAIRLRWYLCYMLHQVYKTKQNKTKQNKTNQNKTKQNKTKQNKYIKKKKKKK